MKIFFSFWLCGDNWRTTGARDVKFGSEIEHKRNYIRWDPRSRSIQKTRILYLKSKEILKLSLCQNETEYYYYGCKDIFTHI